MTYLLSVDPGVSSGIVLGTYSETAPYRTVESWQVGGGLQGLLDWLDTNTTRFGPMGNLLPSLSVRSFNPDATFTVAGVEYKEISSTSEIVDVTICEKFTPLQNTGFSLTLKAVEPLRLEGGLVALGIMPDYLPEHYDVWPRPSAMYFKGGSTKAEKLKRSRAWLKEHGLLLTGKDVGQPDADDAISATLHAFAYLIRKRHLPTMKHYGIGVQDGLG